MKTCLLFISLIFLFLSHIQIAAQAPIGAATPLNQTICSDEVINDIVLSTSNGMDGSTTYAWTRDNTVNVTGIANSGTGNITGTLYNQTGSTQLVNFTIIPTSEGIDGDAFTATITINPITYPSVTIAVDPGSQICDETEVTFTANVTNGGANPSYQWTLNMVSIPGATSNTYIGSDLSNADQIRLLVTADSPCPGTTTSNTITMTVNPLVFPTVSIIASESSICEGSNVTFSPDLELNAGFSPTYQWQLNGVNIVGAINQEYSSNTLIEGDQVNVLVYSSVPCAVNPAVSNTLTVNVYPTPDVIVSPASQSICSDGSATLNGVIGGGASSTTWSGGTGTFSDISDLNAIYTPGAADIAAGTVTLTLTTDDPDGPCGPVSNSTTITIRREVVITTQPYNLGVCESYPASLSVVAIGDDLTYQWYKGDPGSGTPVVNSANISGADSQSLQWAEASLADAGPYYVVVSGDPECETVTSNVVALNVAEVITIDQQPLSQYLCSGGDVTFNINARPAGQITFQWRRNGVNIPGATADTYTIPNVQLGDAGNYDVIISGMEGFYCSEAQSAIAVLTVNEETLSLTSGAGSGDQTICINTPLPDITYQVGGVATGAAITSGSLPSGLNGVYNSGVFTISGTPTETGDFNFIVTSTGPCTHVTATGSITVNPIPQTPTITLNSDTLFSDSELGNQWYADGNLIADAEDSFYKPIVTGTYYTIVTEDGCESEKSNDIYVQITGLEQNEESVLKIYPNPTEDIVTIETENLGGFSLMISASNGQIILQEEVFDPIYSIDLYSISKGVYFITVKSSDKLVTRKIIKL